MRKFGRIERLTGLEFSNPDTQCMVYLPLLIYVLVVLGVTVGQTPAPLSVFGQLRKGFCLPSKNKANWQILKVETGQKL